MENQDLVLPEELTIEMTSLANERSLLAYIRTFVVFLSSGIAILKIEFFQNLRFLAYFFITLSVVWLVIGIMRFLKINKVIKNVENSIKKKQNK